MMKNNNENPPPVPETLADVLASAESETQKTENVKIITEPLNFSLLLNALLKRPLDLLATIEENKSLPWKPLATLSILCLAIFGIVVGAFSGGTQFWAAPMKIILGLSFGALICLPSLYIFSCLSGIKASFQTVLGFLVCAISLLSLLLVGFAPVVWLFSTSSDSIAFFGMLCLILWLVCLSFGFKLINKAALHLGMKSSNHLKVWMIVFTLVTLQLPTTLRPIIGASNSLFHFEDKKFFLHHWLEQIV
ncbi:hypothetical protein ACFPK9_11820 [Rubritalea spongiae]|uniref:Actin-binding WH2 domain-containing protein n=1 Tax=Rubritalea spongiae TaxID=430797 RepID=A0ABW5DZ88_9BACT